LARVFELVFKCKFKFLNINLMSPQTHRLVDFIIYYRASHNMFHKLNENRFYFIIENKISNQYNEASFHLPINITMRLFLAIFFPFIVFFTIKRPLAGITCLVLQIIVIGWLPAALWAVYSLSQFNTDRKIRDFNNLRVG